ncbi:DUF1127 domain-containing protein [Inquilinus limosus]|uniref:DUF1127 domain-containing protein n=1 Tax=Inquilinus limosus TaxID=171674 RepID=UPI003F15F5E8
MTFNFAPSGLDAGRTPGDLGRRIVRGLGDAVRHVRETSLLLRQARYLRQLDDRLLLDIGITRGAIDHAVRHGR